ncbi:uncharacterized protein F5147DRAFT_651176 [Suillus discolor]|uniref:Uncharacterized protein n=1 Tax=Suillus discolor TaxID=1912936 RepID=A0A9P7FC50_9AGAM|nr:uncharacterized protein F5147DRAFT_651176 [Suillus discolor]KAG2111495.1 hypothetical protein F5147DRAFT_651176 [Suillus discolor]
MGWLLKILGAFIMSDISISLVPVEKCPDEVLIPFFRKCTFSKTNARVFQKAENMVLVHLEVNTDSNLKPLTLGEFLNQCNTPCSFGKPIMIGGHTWCHLSSMEFFIWVKRDDEPPINVCSKDPVDMTLVPEIDIDAVTEMLSQGLTNIRNSFVAFQKKLEPSLNCTALTET